ncbi:MAG: PQQ-binding-like beta-propeller repeat protein, partial [Gemmataceae bacterium]
MIAADRAIAAYTRMDAGRTYHGVAALDSATGGLLWSREVAEPGTNGGATNNSTGRHRHELLTLAGDRVVYCTHTGAIIALDLRTGQPAWAIRYPRQVQSESFARHRDIQPPIFHAGKLYIAPTDTKRILALDAMSGATLWQATNITVNHLLGVAEGRLIASCTGTANSIRAFNTATGSTDGPAGWIQSDDAALSTLGRGLIINNEIAWSTHAGICFLSLQSGRPSRPPIREAFGNLAYARGSLIVSGPRSIALYRDFSTGPETVSPARPILVKGEPWTQGGVPVEEPVRRDTLASDKWTSSAITTELREVTETILQIDSHHLAKLNRDQKVEWILNSRGGPKALPTPPLGQPTILPHMIRTENFLLVPTSDEKLWIIDPRTGDRRGFRSTAAVEQFTIPTEIAREAIVHAIGHGELEAFHTETLAQKWTYRIKSRSSYSGEPFRTRYRDTFLLLEIPRNTAREWQILDSETGRLFKNLTVPGNLTPASFDTASFDLDEVVFVHDQAVHRVNYRTDVASSFPLPMPVIGPVRCALLPMAIVVVAPAPRPVLGGPTDPFPHLSAWHRPHIWWHQLEKFAAQSSPPEL